MSTQPGLDGHMRVVELGGELHSDPLHDGTRFQIADVSECHELSEVELLKSKPDGGACDLRSVPLSPIVFGKAPAHFHAGRKWKLVGGRMQSNEADESPRRSFLNRPEPSASFVYELLDSFGKRITLLSRRGRWIVTHDIGVRIHHREWLQV